jgi:hypothetical protein
MEWKNLWGKHRRDDNQWRLETLHKTGTRVVQTHWVNITQYIRKLSTLLTSENKRLNKLGNEFTEQRYWRGGCHVFTDI